MAAPPEVQEIVAANAPHFSVVQEDGRVKIKCELNGHTFPAKAEALETFINGKKYAKLARAAQLERDLAKYEPFIVRSKNLPGMLFCALTGELLNARLGEVKSHLKGRKFTRARERFEADEQELLEEPDMTDGEQMDEDEPEGSDGPGVWIPEEVLQEYEMADAEEEGEAAEGDEAAAEEQEGEEEAAAGGKKAKGRTADKQQGQGKQQQQERQRGKGKGGKAAAAGADTAADGKATAGGKAKQRGSKAEQQQPQPQPQPDKQGKPPKQQKDKAAANGSADGGGKAKAPKAKRVRTG